MKESEASSVWCPKYQACEVHRILHNNRGEFDTRGGGCLGAKCGAWEWEDDDFTGDEGYCGLSVKRSTPKEIQRVQVDNMPSEIKVSNMSDMKIAVENAFAEPEIVETEQSEVKRW